MESTLHIVILREQGEENLLHQKNELSWIWSDSYARGKRIDSASLQLLAVNAIAQ